MFRRLTEPDSRQVTVTIEGRTHRVPAGQSIASAMLAAGLYRTRTSAVSASPRAPYCMMGACYECLVVIDGEPNQQACLTPLRESMVIECQDWDGAPLEPGA
jgi:predicted molibdopterin-dependent oxidoreductase YjgC